MADDLTNLLQANRSSSVLQGIMNPAQVNPLAAMNSAAQTAGGIYDLRQKQAVEAAGQAFQASIDPETGMPRQSVLMQNLAKDPRAAMAAQSSAQAGQTLDTAAYNQHSARLGRGADALGNLIGSYPGGIPGDAFRAAIQQEVATGLLTPADAQQLTQLVSDDPRRNSLVATQLYTHNMNTQQQLEQMYGKPVSVNQGTGIVGGVQNPRTGAISTTGTATPVYADPGTQGQPVHWTTSDGITHDGTWAQYNVDRNNGNVVGPVTTGTSGTQAQPGVPNTANPPRLNQTPPAAQSTPQPTRTDTTQPAPGMQEKWKASAEAYNSDNAAAGGYQARIFPLVQASSILNSGDVTTGPGAEAVNRVKEFLATRAATFGWDAQTIQQAKFDELGKYLTQYVNNQGMSAASDARLASAITGNPNTHITTMANKDVVKALIGLERMKQMAITDFKAQGGQPNQYSDYLSDWQNKHDPRAFIFDMLDGDQRKKMVASMSPAQQRAFAATLDIVERNPGVMGQAAMPGH